MTSSSSSTRDPSTIDRRIDRSFNRVVIAPQRLAREDVENARGGHALSTGLSVCIYMYIVSDIRIIKNHTTYKHHISLIHTPKVGFTPAPPRARPTVFSFRLVFVRMM